MSSQALKPVHTAQAPKALGPYSQAIVVNGQVYTSGQLGIAAATGEFVGPDVESQTRQVLVNLGHVLKEAHSGLDKVIKTTVFLKDMNDFVAMNKIYEEMFAGHRPARSAVEVARLPKDAVVEMECIALVDA
ncbi:hypothetical protein H4R34_001761 [Dimargaris verticillata]|uniref:Uncharacterized protein n=1 Tax=Dimargaris verticillata TaxID=2761393 RepID=A0A9W8BAR6_9FUNG|nr:hypothetical protein H4R34_001761 [Dimargaris verticillata]